MWSERGSSLLSERLDGQLRRAGDRGIFLQIGTLVVTDPSYGPHLMRTDMTIAQARRAGFFAVSELSRHRLEEAENVQKQILSTAAHVFAASRWVAGSLIHDCGVPPDRITVLYPSAELSVCAADCNPDREGAEILFVGLDWERKGGPLLFEAFKLIQREVSGATLRVVGCRPTIRHPGVHIEGRLDRSVPEQAERLAWCYRRASCFCMPSLFEPFGIAFAEAASIGLPAVSIDVGSRREAVIHGTTGFLAERATPEALASALLKVVGDAEGQRALGEFAQIYAQRHFSWAAAVSIIETVVREIQAQPHRAVTFSA
jgi:glycosyltransferase involved in cell wall biosynthesis